MARVIPRQWINMQTGELTNEALLFLNDLQVGNDPDSPGINTVLAGVNQVQATTDAIIAGTQPLADVVIVGLGSVTQVDTAQNANIAAAGVAASAGALTASASPSSIYEEATGPGAITTDPVTITAAGGTPGYTYAWTQIEGVAFTINAPAAASTDFTSPSLFPGQSRAARFKCVVTDAALATFDVEVAATVVSTE